jgi:valyl-tRNA synthetase
MKREGISNFQFPISNFKELEEKAEHENDKEWVKKVRELSAEVTKYLDGYQFNLAAERVYEFVWHQFADKYIEDVKNRIDDKSFLVLSSLFSVQLKLLHPFMPFVTEVIYQKLGQTEESIMVSKWPMMV